MKIIHNLSLSVSADAKAAFSALEITLADGFAAFKLDESDPRWPQVAELVERFNIVDVAWTEFSKSEIETAEHLQVLADSHHGYPEPSDDFGYREVSYDTSTYCADCGCGLFQSSPLRTRKTSRPKRKLFFQLNWVFDALFVARETWETVFCRFGIAQQPLLNDRTGQPLPDVVQLLIPQTRINLELAGLPSETCVTCGRVKYEPFSRGFFPAPKESTDLPLFRPAPYFGSGARAHHAVIMSSELYRALNKVEAVKGLFVAPLATTETSR
jgi:hypothetical protein